MLTDPDPKSDRSSRLRSRRLLRPTPPPVDEPGATLARLTALARASAADVLVLDDEGDGFRLDLDKARELAAAGAIKRFDVLEVTGPDGESLESVTIEFHDPLPALAALARHHGLDRPREDDEAGGVFNPRMAAAMVKARDARLAEMGRTLTIPPPTPIEGGRREQAG